MAEKEMSSVEMEARIQLREFQNKYGKFITPEWSVKIGNVWRDALADGRDETIKRATNMIRLACELLAERAALREMAKEG